MFNYRSMTKIQDRFKQDIAKIYDRRQDSYDRGRADNWHFKLARRLVECADLRAAIAFWI